MKSYVETTEFKVGELVDVSPFVSRVNPKWSLGMIIEVMPHTGTFLVAPNYKILFGEKIIEMNHFELRKTYFSKSL